MEKYQIENNIKQQITENNTVIANKSKENVRLFKKLLTLQSNLPPKTKERYDNELASDNWKKTEYWKNRHSNGRF